MLSTNTIHSNIKLEHFKDLSDVVEHAIPTLKISFPSGGVPANLCLIGSEHKTTEAPQRHMAAYK